MFMLELSHQNHKSLWLFDAVNLKIEDFTVRREKENREERVSVNKGKERRQREKEKYQFIFHYVPIACLIGAKLYHYSGVSDYFF